jgi:hypothetical protein
VQRGPAAQFFDDEFVHVSDEKLGHAPSCYR